MRTSRTIKVLVIWSWNGPFDSLQDRNQCISYMKLKLLCWVTSTSPPPPNDPSDILRCIFYQIFAYTIFYSNPTCYFFLIKKNAMNSKSSSRSSCHPFAAPVAMHCWCILRLTPIRVFPVTIFRNLLSVAHRNLLPLAHRNEACLMKLRPHPVFVLIWRTEMHILLQVAQK